MSWTARIIVALLLALILGALVGGYIASLKPPPVRHYEQIVPSAGG